MIRLLLAGLFFAPLACNAGPAVIKLGLVAPPAESDAASLERGARLAVEESNETERAQVTLEVRGENGQWGTVGNDAGALAGDRQVDGMIAPSDGASSHLVLQVSGRMRVPVASVCPDASVTEAGVPWAVRVLPSSEKQAEALFSAWRSEASAEWWALVPPEHPGRAARRDLAKAARMSGIRLDRFLEQGAESASAAREVAAASPGGVLVWLPPSEAALVIKALRLAGYRGHLAGPCSIDSPEFTTAAGSAAEGILIAEPAQDPGFRMRAQRFDERFFRQFGVRPDYAAAAAHDAAQVLIENLRRAGNTPAYRQFPPVLPTFGVTGEIRFDASGNRTGSLRVLAFRQDRFVPAPPFNP